MRILKEGITIEYRVTCPKCSCEFICTENEIKQGYLVHECTFKGIFKTVYCPHCHKEIKETETEFKELNNENN